MFTVARFGVGGTLAATLTTTNCIESMISIAKRTTPSHEMEGRLDEEALGRRRHPRKPSARSDAYEVTRTWPSWSPPLAARWHLPLLHPKSMITQPPE